MEKIRRLKVTQIVVTDDKGKRYFIDLTSDYLVRTAGNSTRDSAHFLAGIFAAGGWDAVIQYLKEADDKKEG